MTHNDICKIGAKWLKKHDQNIIVPNCKTVATEIKSATVTGEIPDIIGWCSWASVLIEVKTSRSDFLADMKKVFRKNPEMGMGQFRYFLCPKGLINKDETPNGWGLLYIDDDKGIKIIKKSEDHEYYFWSERTILLSLLRRSN